MIRETGFACGLTRCSNSILGKAMVVILVAMSCGCGSPSKESASQESVVVYCALDREFSGPLLDHFRRETSIEVQAKFDVESNKTVGLVNAIIQEAKRPRCDVFWNNEILHTLRLQRKGLLEVYQSPSAVGFPKAYTSATHHWHGFAARARVFIVNTDLVPEDEIPQSIHDLVDERWAGRSGIARPLFGTTATHAAVLFDAWGAERASEFFMKVKQQVKVLSGNRQVAEAVATGRLAFGLTDTDDAFIEQERGSPIRIVFIDQGPGQTGTLLIPNTLCVLKGAPNESNARKLVDFLLSAPVEDTLANGLSAQFPLNPSVAKPPRLVTPAETKWMDVDFEAASTKWETAAAFLRETF